MARTRSETTEPGGLRDLARDVASVAAAQALMLARVALGRAHKAIDEALERRMAKGRR